MTTTHICRNENSAENLYVEYRNGGYYPCSAREATDSDLCLEWNSGSMTICMDNYFPCTRADLKFLVERTVNKMDSQKRNEAVDAIKEYFQERISLCEYGMEKARFFWISPEGIQDPHFAKEYKPLEKEKKRFKSLLKYIGTL